jgi:ferritin-like metal-binding protein YciE
MPKTTTMDQLFVDEIRDLYDAEKQLTKALPKMAKAASSDDLRMAFEGHLEQTQGHVSRLEEIFNALGEKGTGKKCTAMQGLIKEGEDLMEMDQSALRDAGLIAAAQKVEHYEISGYGSARTHASLIGNLEAVSLLDETLNEEKEANLKLNDLAENTINNQAMEESEASGTEAGMKVRRTGARTRTAGS